MSHGIAYYNEIEPYAAEWLRNLIKAGHIAPGDVDTRSIEDVRPDDLRGYVQCHFFAGIGGWSLAARLAGWPDERPLWTGSCPCQPFSSAARGRNAGLADERHLWPAWYELIVAARPPVVFGEQVDEASAWLDGVFDGMEAARYAVWAAVLPAYGAQKDHGRERIYFACHADREGKPKRAFHGEVAGMPWPGRHAGDVVRADGVPDRVAIMRAFGNAVVPELAAEVIGAYLDTEMVG